MALPKFNDNVDVITGLADKPIQSAPDLKAKFDEGVKRIKSWINITFIPALDTELEKKVDKIPGKQLSTQDYTTEDKEKLSGLTKVTITSGTGAPTGGQHGDIYIQYFD